MTPIKSLPDLPWTEQAAKEIARTPNLVEESDFAWQVDDLFIAGWNYTTLVDAPWFWFALTTNFEKQHIRRLLQLRPALPKNLQAAVERGYEAGDRFAQFFGFKPTGEVHTINGDDYLMYRRA